MRRNLPQAEKLAEARSFAARDLYVADRPARGYLARGLYRLLKIPRLISCLEKLQTLTGDTPTVMSYVRQDKFERKHDPEYMLLEGMNHGRRRPARADARWR